ncbi:carbonic anhydrase 15 isoform X1 [Callorhinchus milii]|uniref:carbonic anhydrase 15 isoform X1 n=1 Tax=Callorhinchus milii TaxID=7868 RepID=UPI001C3F8EDA|nr:carbonic anhydrase 15 isoform X1 [Callorhinchus milii]
MRSVSALFPTFFTLSLITQSCCSVHWCYDSQSQSCGPKHWKEIQSTCGGKSQSPINIDMSNVDRDNNLQHFVFEGYSTVPPGQWSIANNGHSVQVTLDTNVSISGGGLVGKYKALQLHFHWGNGLSYGSEHTINKKQYPMELHIVHMSERYTDIRDALKKTDGLAVLGFMLEVTETDNPNYNTLTDVLEKVSHQGDKVWLSSTFQLNSILPKVARLSQYYRYQGSLTTPNCSEAVVWSVFEEPISISKAQLIKFANTLYFSARGESEQKMQNNFRSPQPLNGRRVSASKDATINSCPVHTSSLLSVVLVLGLGLGLRIML